MSEDKKMPWEIEPLNKWSIVGMNHYHVDGVRHLFVAMTKAKAGRVIQEEGPDDKYIWNRLWHKACAEMMESKNEKI